MNTATVNPTAAEFLMAKSATKELRATHARFMTWQVWCDAFSAGSIDEATWATKRPISKAAKHRMYDQAARVHSLLHLDGDRPHTLAQIADLLNQAETVLRNGF